jgi:hypothetical protein
VTKYHFTKDNSPLPSNTINDIDINSVTGEVFIATDKGLVSFKSLLALGIEDYTLDVQLKVYPNPTAKLLYVSHPEQTTFSIGIADLNGRQIYSGTINTITPLDIGQYPQGIYLVTIASTETHKKNCYKIIKK